MVSVTTDSLPYRRLENIAIWAKGQALLPRSILWREVWLEFKIVAGVLAN